MERNGKVKKEIKKEVKKEVQKAKASLPQKKAKAHKKKNAAGQNRARGLQISNCVMEYCKLVDNPFGANVTACMPSDANSLQPAGRFSTWIKGTGSTSTAAGAGFGFVSFKPFNMAFNNCATTYYPVLVSGATYGSTSGTDSSGVAGVTYVNSNSPYTTTSTQLFRVICAGLRIRYRGTQLNRGGSIYPLIVRDHKSWVTMSVNTIAGCQADPKVHALPVKNDWTQIVSVPMEEEEFEWYGYGGIGYPNFANPCMVFLLQGVDGSTACTFEYEAYTHFEVMGDGVTYMPRFVDPAGAAAVFNAINRRGSDPAPHHKPWLLTREVAQEIGALSAPLER